MRALIERHVWSYDPTKRQAAYDTITHGATQHGTRHTTYGTRHTLHCVHTRHCVVLMGCGYDRTARTAVKEILGQLQVFQPRHNAGEAGADTLTSLVHGLMRALARSHKVSRQHPTSCLAPVSP